MGIFADYKAEQGSNPPKGARLCSNCKQPGHYAKTCKAAPAPAPAGRLASFEGVPGVEITREPLTVSKPAERVSKPSTPAPAKPALGYDPHTVIHADKAVDEPFKCGASFGKYGKGWGPVTCPDCLALSQPVK
jgi:hypothetical protein